MCLLNGSKVINSASTQNWQSIKMARRPKERIVNVFEKIASILSKRASTSFSRRTGRHEKSFRPSEGQTIAPDVENLGQIVGLNIENIHIYIYIYIHIYPHRKRRRAGGRLAREGLA